MEVKGTFNVKSFVRNKIAELRNKIGNKRALIACSGGVDSTTCATLTYRAIGENLVCVFLDDNFMRLNEPEEVVKTLSSPPLNLPVRLIDVRDRFMRSLEGIEDAEEKRKAFRETFYRVLSEVAKEEGCQVLVQGTIAPDVIETKGEVKTQHNVLEQIGIDPIKEYGFQVVEPLVSLYKPQVREVARYLNVPRKICERQPFCGPGLSVRCVGKIDSDKLESLRKATAIVEEQLAGMGIQQYFAAIIDDEIVDDPAIPAIRSSVSTFFEIPSHSISVYVPRSKATGIREGKRLYGKMCLLSIRIEGRELYKPPIDKLLQLQAEVLAENPSFARFLYEVAEERRKGSYVIAIRAVNTVDFMTADAALIDLDTLTRISSSMMEKCPMVSTVYYDLTPKPPATIEFE